MNSNYLKNLSPTKFQRHHCLFTHEVFTQRNVYPKDESSTFDYAF
jgi:hypothetical protein